MEKRKIRIYFDGNLFVLFQLFRLQEDWILQEAGSCLENVLTLTVYLCDIDDHGCILTKKWRADSRAFPSP